MIQAFPVWLGKPLQAERGCPDYLRFVDSFDYARGDQLHEAQDIIGPEGADLLAVEPGYAIRYTSENAGNGVLLWCPESGRRYLYSHLQFPATAPDVGPGRRVRAGERIGSLGKTGNAATTCPHLHFGAREIRRVDAEPNVDAPNKWRDPAGAWWRTGAALNPYNELVAAPRVPPRPPWWVWPLGFATLTAVSVGAFWYARRTRRERRRR